jgi:hypothetical protein
MSTNVHESSNHPRGSRSDKYHVYPDIRRQFFFITCHLENALLIHNPPQN